MSSVRLRPFTIGEGDWLSTVMEFTESFAPDYWSGFRPCDREAVSASEAALCRTFPLDFRTFLLTVGSGNFPVDLGGGIDSPQEIAEGCMGPLWQILGTARFASDEDHRRFYVSRGAFNAFRGMVSSEDLVHSGVSLLDLLQVGSDGSCCYHQLFVGESPRPFGYCLLTPEGTYEDQAPNWSAALRGILLGHAEIRRDRKS